MFNNTNLEHDLSNIYNEINNEINNENNNENNNLQNIEINLFYNYMSFINNYINIINNNISYLNSTNNTLHNISNNLDYYYYTLYRNNRNNINNRRVRRRRNDEYYNQETFYNNFGFGRVTGNYIQNQEEDHQEEEQEDQEDQENQEDQEENQEDQEENQEDQENQENQENQEFNNIELTDDRYYFNLSNSNIESVFNNNTTNMLFSEISDPLNNTCSITQEDFNDSDNVCIINNCGHIFYTNALHNWYKRHYTCPNCRYNFLENTNFIRYTTRDNSARMLLTQEQFRNFLANNIVNSFFNNTNNIDSSGNFVSIFFSTN